MRLKVRKLLRKMGKAPCSMYLLMDRAYEGDETRQLALDLGFIPVVPPSRSLKSLLQSRLCFAFYSVRLSWS